MPSEKLSTYKGKRNFSKTPEPVGRKRILKPSSLFVIQKHEARRLHFDFRLEVAGVLVSWAIPKGLSVKLNEKRLAIRTEDHPLKYADFEGTIPKGEYGGGTVLIWDKGAYEPQYETDNHLHYMENGLKNGALKILLKGKRIQGIYAMALIRRQEKKEQWVIFKVNE